MITGTSQSQQGVTLSQGLSPHQTQLLTTMLSLASDIAKLHATLIPGTPLVTTATTRVAGDIAQVVQRNSNTGTVTITRV
jgi:hypothetical protein